MIAVLKNASKWHLLASGFGHAESFGFPSFENGIYWGSIFSSSGTYQPSPFSRGSAGASRVPSRGFGWRCAAGASPPLLWVPLRRGRALGRGVLLPAGGSSEQGARLERQKLLSELLCCLPQRGKPPGGANPSLPLAFRLQALPSGFPAFAR